ncbi:MAG: tetratricopeptide repeat protein [Verrucomicrobiia bacterium]|jgi:tetratricopeptide (TPR) repeat protein
MSPESLLLAKITQDQALTYAGYTLAAWVLLKLFLNADNKLHFLIKIGLTVFVTMWFIKAQKKPPYGLLYSIGIALLYLLLWGGETAEMLSNTFTSGMDRGGKVDKTARLSKAEALRKQGRYEEALDEAQAQLKQFKHDFDCYMLIASIQAEDMDQLPVAAALIQSVVARKRKVSKKQMIYALNTLVDWHLKYGKDPDAAVECLEQIVEKAYGSKAAISAEQRIAKMVDRETLEAADQPKGKVLPEYERDIGLKGGTVQIQREQIDPEEQAEQFTAHLNEHPNDWDTREQLALIYLEHYNNLPCAIDEVEKMIGGRGTTKDDCCRWLHMIADWQSRVARDTDAARLTLDRIIRRYPGTSHAEKAENAQLYMREN